MNGTAVWIVEAHSLLCAPKATTATEGGPVARLSPLECGGGLPPIDTVAAGRVAQSPATPAGREGPGDGVDNGLKRLRSVGSSTNCVVRATDHASHGAGYASSAAASRAYCRRARASPHVPSHAAVPLSVHEAP